MTPNHPHHQDALRIEKIMTKTASSSKSFSNKIFWWLPFGSVPEVLPSELAEKLQNPTLCPQLLDVRTHTEWQKGHLPSNQYPYNRITFKNGDTEFR